MDAKPIRGLKLSDENAMPLMQHKVLHSRNKSSPALSSLAAKGALKMGAKRAAFGDISQTTRGNRALSELQNIGKDVKLQQEKKVTTLQQPAQKLLSTLNAASIIPVTKIDENSHVKRVLSKRATTIFKDYSTLPQIVTPQIEDNLLQQPATEVQPPQSLVHTTEKIVIAPSAPVIVEEESLADSKVITDLKDLHIPATTKVEASTQEISINPAVPAPRTEQVSQMHTAEEIQAAEAKIMSILHKNDDKPQQIVQHVPIRVSNGTSPIDPLSYLEEDYDEQYAEDDYVTAKSGHSKPENITEGNLTTVLAPKPNPEVEIELAAAAAVVGCLKEPAEIDDEAWDISMVSEYKEEIFDYYRELEIRLAPNPHYMDVQTEIQWSMRSVLIDWVVQVHDRFQLLPETLLLTVNIIDRFLSIKVVSINKLQLVGATALFVAAKYEEVNCPTLKEMVFMVDNSYDEDEILKAERFMLTLLGFDLGWPGPLNFLRRISTADDYDLETRTVAKYFLELTIMDERFLGCPPSFVAAGAHCLARLMLQKGQWSTAHVHYSGYTYNQLLPLIFSIMECLENPTQHHNAIYEKYCKQKFRGAAGFAREELRRGFRPYDSHTNMRINYDSLCRSNSINHYIYRDVPGYVAWSSNA